MSAGSPDPSLTALQDAIETSVRARFGGRFSDEDIAHLRQRVARARRIMADLDRVDLRNGDEPDVVFAAAEDCRP